MAAETRHTFSSEPKSFGTTHSSFLKSTQDKVWSTEVLATASTGEFWEDDPEEIVKRKIDELKCKFHMGRQLQIKHLPRDVEEKEIYELLSEFPVQKVYLHFGNIGSGVARAAIEDPEMLDYWDKERIFMLRGQRVPVMPTNTEMMLCVARLPLTLSETQFHALVSAPGKVRRSILMISEKSGKSKGYGFVEYVSKEVAMQARKMLDGKEIESFTLCCDWLDPSHITFESLHSKCLYVDRLPKDFRDMGEFRKIFSAVVNPPYCQIALKNGCPQDWGLVEYSTSDDAEAAQASLNGHCLHGQNIRISYYIPGVRAINLYLKLLTEPARKDKTTGLLPDPPAPAVFQQLQNLARQNPVFAQNLQNIIWTQIHNPQVGDEKNKTYGTNKMGINNSLYLGNPQMLSELENLIKKEGIPQNVATPSSSPFLSQVELQSLAYPPPLNTGWTADLKNTDQKDSFKERHQQRHVPLLPNPTVALNPSPEIASHTYFPTQTSENINDSTIALPRQISVQNSPSFRSKTYAGKANTSHLSQNVIPRGNKISDVSDNRSGELQERINTMLNNSHDLNQLLGNITSAIQTDISSAVPITFPPTFPSMNQSSVFFPKTPPDSQQSGNRWPTPVQPISQPANTHSTTPVLSNSLSGRQPMTERPMPGVQHVFRNPVPMTVTPTKPVGFAETAGLHSPFQNSWMPNPYLGFPISPLPYSGAGLVPHLWSQTANPYLVSPPGFATPIGYKRKYNPLLPSPEASPEGTYVGQHSQGLGGHYADSYFKRKKKN